MHLLSLLLSSSKTEALLSLLLIPENIYIYREREYFFVFIPPTNLSYQQRKGFDEQILITTLERMVGSFTQTLWTAFRWWKQQQKKQSNSKISWLDIRIPTDVRCLGMFVVWFLGPHTSSPGVWMSRVCRLNTKSLIHAWPIRFNRHLLLSWYPGVPRCDSIRTKNWLLFVGYIHLSYISQHFLNTPCFTSRHSEFVIPHNYISILLVCSGFDWTT